ncbi:unnamed protein product [Owenia fusiformis]|uniref:Uncharacterized protein n=1 Tax=Owenia fusiformis TaxID=6347 RepID=A0A8J1U4M8_OWEFU|nr:unnamed protein product [Owenia fusiformis]
MPWKMEDELKCAVCDSFYTNPILLPCTHSICLGCATNIQVPIHQLPTPSEDSSPSLAELDLTEIDKLSLLSETDSGVVCNTNSRPNSYVGTPSIGSIFFNSIQGTTQGLNCPICKKNIYLDETGVAALPKNRSLENIVEKYSANKEVSIRCQLCEGSRNEASVMCEQCEVFYCSPCREKCHPARGPFLKHSLVPPVKGKTIMHDKNRSRELTCIEHKDEQLSMFCLLCKTSVCYICVQDGRHINHDVQALGAMCKSQKSELSQILQSLSERARTGTEFIQDLKRSVDQIQENCIEFEASVVAQCDDLIEAVKHRKQELLDHIECEKDEKQRTLREQVSTCTGLLQKTTALLQFSIEVLKESDPAAFLQVSSGLIHRVSSSDVTFNKEMGLQPVVSPDFELTLDNASVLHAIQNLNYFQLKAPGTPNIVPEECSAENNSVTIAWQPYPGSVVDMYTLEMDDGNQGQFREVYCGRETICTVDGLHFRSIYNARVKAHNQLGNSPYSESIALQTADMAWFSYDSTNCHPDIEFSNENMTVTCSDREERTVLSTVGFSKGVHYWEMKIDRYDNQSDPAFGVARFDTTKDAMLGKDDKGWCMYVDSQRSWFKHNGQHKERTIGGIKQGSVIGVLLDLNQHTLSFYINDEPHGPIAFTGLHGVFYPAVSLNRNVQVTCSPGLDAPSESEHDDVSE